MQKTKRCFDRVKEGLVEFWHFFWAPPTPEFWEMPVEEEKNPVLPMPKPKQEKDIFVAFKMEDSDYTYTVNLVNKMYMVTEEA